MKRAIKLLLILTLAFLALLLSACSAEEERIEITEVEDRLEGRWALDYDNYYFFYLDGTYKSLVDGNSSMGTYEKGDSSVLFTEHDGTEFLATFDGDINTMSIPELGIITFTDSPRGTFLEGIWSNEGQTMTYTFSPDGSYTAIENGVEHLGDYVADRDDITFYPDEEYSFEGEIDTSSYTVKIYKHQETLIPENSSIITDNSIDTVTVIESDTEVVTKVLDGTWSYNGDMHYTFNADGTYMLSVTGSDTYGTYTFDGATVLIDDSTSVLTYDEALNTLHDVELGTFEPNGGGVMSGEPPLGFEGPVTTGKWGVADGSATIALFEDGTYYKEDVTGYGIFGTYEKVGSDIAFYEADGTLVLGTYSYDDNAFSLLGYDQYGDFVYISDPTEEERNMASGEGFSRSYVDETYANSDEGYGLTLDSSGNFTISYDDVTDSGTYEIYNGWILVMEGGLSDYRGEYVPSYGQIYLSGFYGTFYLQ